MDLKIIIAFLAIVCLTSGNPVANNPANDDGNDVTTNVGCSPGFSWCVNKKQCCPSKSICGALYPCYRDSGHHVPGPSVLSDVNNDVTTSVECAPGFDWCGNVQKCCYLRSKCGRVSPCSYTVHHVPGPSVSSDVNNDVTTSLKCVAGFGWCGNVQKCCYLRSKCGHVSPCSGPFPEPHRSSDVNNDVTTSVECASGFGWCGNVQKCCYLRSKCGHVSPCSGPFPEPHRSSDVNNDVTTSVECASGFGWCGNVQKCCYLGSKCGRVSPCSGPFPGPRRSSDVNIEETYDPALDANINEKETLPFEEQIEFE